MSATRLLRLDAGRDRLLVRADVGDDMRRLLPAFLDGRILSGAHPLAGGRGTALSVPLSAGGRAVLRRNLRGGVPARLVRDLYFGWRPRPFAEVEALERLRAAALPVPEPLGAITRPAAPGVYRGAMATAEIAGAVNLWEYLRATASRPRRQTACARALGLVDRLLAAGAMHPDLNLTNFLVVDDAGEPGLWLVDCDRVRFGTVGEAQRRRAVARLQRSARKLDRAGEWVDPAWLSFAPGAGGA